MASINVKIDNLFSNLIAVKNIDILKLNVVGKNFKKTFGSDIKTTLKGNTLFNSDFSFIIYYKIDKSYTVFNNPVKNLLEMRDSKIFNKEYKPKLKQGDLIIFPSYLEHWVKPNSNNITIAGNIKIINIIK
jgi:hypothetical protein